MQKQLLPKRRSGMALLLHMLDKADVFISHAWKYAFLDVVAAVEAPFKHAPDKVSWFDVFSNNQHKAGGVPFVWWETTFRSAIEDFKHTVLVSCLRRGMAPWCSPAPGACLKYSRLWIRKAGSRSL
jgi:hypothetical protein